MSTPHTAPAVVTGASSGIGAAVARRLAREHRGPLLLVGRDVARLDAVAAATGGVPLAADVATPGGRAAVVDAVAKAGGDVPAATFGDRSGFRVAQRQRSHSHGTAGPGAALLVHAAGLGAAGPLTGADGTDGGTDVATLVATNLTAPIELTRALLPGLLAARGAIALVASVAALGVANEAAYSATKAGLRGFADALRLESGLVVTTVLPGAVDTPFLARRGYDRAVPRPVPPERVADALVRAVARGRAEVFVPGWLTVASRVHGVAPGVFARLSARFG